MHIILNLLYIRISEKQATTIQWLIDDPVWFLQHGYHSELATSVDSVQIIDTMFFRLVNIAICLFPRKTCQNKYYSFGLPLASYSPSLISFKSLVQIVKLDYLHLPVFVLKICLTDQPFKKGNVKDILGKNVAFLR